MSEKQEKYEVAIRDNPVPMMALSLDEARLQVRGVQEFIKSLMVEGVDYGTIPGTPKPTLYQPGAHKLINIYALDVATLLLDKTEDWDKPFFYYRYVTELKYGGRVVGTCEGSCNSMEARYRWRWVPEHKLPVGLDKATLESRGGKVSEFDFAIEKAETGGKYGKPAEYWQKFRDAIESGAAAKIQRKAKSGKEYGAWEIDGTSYRIPNDDIFSLVNTLQKMGQKRSVVGATLMATRTGDIFTQDIEDMNIIEGDFRQVPLKPRGDEEANGKKATNGTTKGDASWTKDKNALSGFWAWAGKKTLSNDDVHKALGVESVKDYEGDMGQAKTQINAWIGERVNQPDPVDISIDEADEAAKSPEQHQAELMGNVEGRN